MLCEYSNIIVIEGGWILRLAVNKLIVFTCTHFEQEPKEYSIVEYAKHNRYTNLD